MSTDSFDTLRQSIETRFVTRWGARTPYALPNIDLMAAARANSTRYEIGDTVDVGLAFAWYECTTAGTSAVSDPGSWPTTIGGTITDGTVVWTAREVGKGVAPWTRLSINEETNKKINVGTVHWTRLMGNIVFQIFTPARTGTVKANTLADAIAAIFSIKQFDGIVCRSSSPRKVGEKDGWYQVNVWTKFQDDMRRDDP